MVKKYEFLTDEQVDHFMKHGFIRLEQAFSREKAKEWSQDVWVRLDMDPNDRSTWKREWTNMPVINSEKIETFSPKAYGAMLELIGGADRLRADRDSWGDNFIVNLGEPEHLGQEPPSPKELNKWHCDGDGYVHFLDSPEVGLLMIPLFSDVRARGGATYICPDGLTKTIQLLAEHPEGVGGGAETNFHTNEMIQTCEQFVECTGNMGDVFLIHPYMLHTQSRNNTGIPRLMINPWAALNEPHKYKRENPDDYSLVELKTIHDLGKTPEEGYDFKITTARKNNPNKRRHNQQAEWKAEELARLEKIGRAPKVLSTLVS